MVITHPDTVTKMLRPGPDYTLKALRFYESFNKVRVCLGWEHMHACRQAGMGAQTAQV